jgi:histidyl-tRNA synthetase
MINKKYLQPPKGTRDFSGEIAKQRIKLIRFFQDQFKLFDFEPLITPNLEYKKLVDSKDINTYGEEKKLMYSFKDLANRELILKYDQTLPLARFVSSNPAMSFPYKRYAIERTYRYENVQKGRYREFWQCDFDIVGSSSIKADVFIIYVVLSISKKLDFNNAKVYVNNRKIINSILEYLNIDSNLYLDVIRELDKIEKIGLDKVKDRLTKLINKEKTNELINILNIKGTNIEKLNNLKKYLSKELFSSLNSFFKYLKFYSIEKDVVFDLFLARGLDYYTSYVFELIDKTKDVGSLGGGGRYNKMISQLCNRDIPATGFAFGFERIFNILNKDKFFTNNCKKIFIATPNNNSKEVFKVSNILFNKNIINSFDFNNKNLSKQIKYALKNNFDYILFCDLDEIKEKNKYRLKNLKTKEEKDLDIKAIINIIKKELKNN